MQLFLCVFMGVALLAAPAAAAQWTDAMGRLVDVPENPRRIISLVPSVTEVLFALELGDRVVGVTDACTWPEEARRLPKVGSYSGPSLEAVLAQRPDIVFAAADMSAPAWVGRLEDLGIPVYVVYPRTLKDTAQSFRDIAAVCGVSERGSALAEELERAVEKVRQGRTMQQGTRTLICVMFRPLVVASPRTLAGDLLQIVGGENIVPEEGPRWPTWGPEALLTADPELIIVSPHPGEMNPEAFFRQFPELHAVKKDRIVSIEPDWLQRPGPRLVKGLEALADALKAGDEQSRAN